MEKIHDHNLGISREVELNTYVYNLYKTYEKLHRNIPRAKIKAINKVMSSTNISRSTIYKILREFENQPSSPKEKQFLVTDLSHEVVKAIDDKILSLIEIRNGDISVREIYNELKLCKLFTGTTGDLNSLLRQMGYSYCVIKTKWILIKKAIHKPTMMEVKQSPATQMDFRSRSTREELQDDVEEDLEHLFDEGVGKSLTPSSDDCDSKTPILNGMKKCTETLSNEEILDVKDEEMDSNDKVADSMDAKKIIEDTEEVNDDMDLFDLDLEEEPNTKNTEATTDKDASKLRDTGDDLDTLLSKINDLVEDCMETKTAGESTTDEVVEIPDEELDDALINCTADNEMGEKPEENANESNGNKKTGEGTAEILEEVSVKLGVTKSAETPSEKQATEKMDVDEELVDYGDDIVCLDSPIMESEKELTEDQPVATSTTENLAEKEVEEREIPPNEEGGIEKKKSEEKIKETLEPLSEKSKAIEDDEIYLIEDDDDDEPVKEQEALPSKSVEEDSMKDDETTKQDCKNELESETSKEPEKETIDEQTETEPEPEPETSLDPACEEDKETKDSKVSSHEDDDDDIVCLDDSFEELEEKEPQSKEDTTADQQKPTQDTEKKNPEVETNSTTDPTDQQMPEKVEEEPAAAPQVETKLPENVEEQVSDKVEEAPVEEEPKLDKPDSQVQKPSEPLFDDDIVILDDDDDEDGCNTTKIASTVDADKNSATVEVAEDKTAAEDNVPSDKDAALKESTILSDNSDNARDGVEEKDDKNGEKNSKDTVQPLSESNSCSNSSNLLKESANKEPEETSEQPPAKRIRLSQDDASSHHSTVSQEDTKSNTIDGDEAMDVSLKGNEGNKSLKRVLSTESVSSEVKKVKTDKECEKTDDKKVKLEENEKTEGKPMALYPPPKLEAPALDLSLDFLRRFKKSVHKMNKSDLEELVLQKIVEAIVHKSEFSEMRDLIEKQEKIILGHRSKISELSKQFRDLEMVHNRVLKDLETKNSQFIMPVKITRAVGLQVFFPNKKLDQPMALSTPAPTQTPPAASITRSANIVTNTSSSTSQAEHSSTSSSNPATSYTASSSTPKDIPSPVAAATNTPQPSTAPRRGCLQKLTPMRPDTPRNSPLNRAMSTYDPSTSPSLPVSRDSTSNQKILNRSLGQKKASNSVYPGNSISATTPPASESASPVPVPRTGPVPIKPKPTTASPLNTSLISGAQKGTRIQTQIGQPDPPMPAVATVMNSSMPSSQTPSTVVKPKPAPKSVIDLTDEDDIVPAAPTPSQAPPTQQTTSATSSPNIPGNRSHYKVSVVPQQQLQQSKPNPPKQTPQRAALGKSPIPPKANGVDVVVRHAAAPNQIRYRHPAPLPNQPVHSNNPAWKLPPARPTIRISNLESGIVISWTIDCTSKEKYAESTSYQIYAYQETSGPPLVESWRHVGDVKAMLLPMAVTLTQFQEGQRYYFAVRAVDAHNRCGPFSFAKTWSESVSMHRSINNNAA